MNRIDQVVPSFLGKWSDPKVRKRQLESLFKYPAIQALIRQHPEIPREQYHRSFSQLYQFVMEEKNCKRCPGLERCPNQLAGHFSQVVVYQDVLDLQMHKCDRLKSHEENNRKKHLIRSHHIPKEIIHSTFDEIEQDKGRMDAIEAAIDFCNQFAVETPKKGLYFYGPLGVGKSRIAGAIANNLVQYAVPSYMLYVPDFMREIQDSIQENSLHEKLDVLKKVTVLILDDIGAEYLSLWKRDEVLGAILQYRAAEDLPTIYTSNLALDELEEHFANTVKGEEDRMKAKRIMERIRHYVTPYCVEGPNRRVT